jgi:hypothetical protein
MAQNGGIKMNASIYKTKPPREGDYRRINRAYKRNRAKLPVLGEIMLGDTKYRIRALTEPEKIKCCIADRFTNGEWQEVKNIEVRMRIRKLFDLEEGNKNGTCG